QNEKENENPNENNDMNNQDKDKNSQNNVNGEEEAQEDILQINPEYKPEYPNTWSDGAFHIVINHCYNCHQHKTTTRHMEYSFIDKFNEIGNAIHSIFPNVYIIGNYDEIEYYGSFDVYLHGIGPVFDNKHRFFIYKKSNSNKFPTTNEIWDKWIALSIVYGSSVNMERAQRQFTIENTLSKPSKYYHEFPIDYSEDALKAKNEAFKKKPQEQKIDANNTQFYCTNWGCGQIFVQSNNTPVSCIYHPGIWQFGSYNGYWPECWSCCEGTWDSPGCTQNYHKGVIAKERIMWCWHHGEINTFTKHPDSACGAYFTKDSTEGCLYHPGYFKNGQWTCCKGGDKFGKGCHSTNHETVEYPSDEAKLYFYPKPVNNPGIMKGVTSVKNKKVETVGELICKCDYYKEIKVVFQTTKTKLELLLVKQQKELTEPKYCLNWACEKVFYEKDYEKGLIKNCRSHSGKWDHGCTGTKMSDYVDELKNGPKEGKQKIIWWKPHWTCCQGDWSSKGCRWTRHHGPWISSLGKGYKRYCWPNIRWKWSFNKVITDWWRKTLVQYTYEEDKVRNIWNTFYKEKQDRVM
ncbi:MAG: hypothetical protein ACRC42_00615, partial [Mycoplasma sp.]